MMARCMFILSGVCLSFVVVTKALNPAGATTSNLSVSVSLTLMSVAAVVDDVRRNVTFENDPMTNSVDPEFIWATTTVAVGDTAVLHCSFDAIFSQLRNGNVSNIS